MKDIIKDKYGDEVPMVKVLDHGLVELIDCMPRNVRGEEDTADYAIAEAARCSYQRGTKTINDDKVLIRYLMRHNHTSPFEMIEFKFRMKMPIFTARQMIRHRTASINELSGRYSEMPDEFYVPEDGNCRMQDAVNKQGSEGLLSASTASGVNYKIDSHGDFSFSLYKSLLSDGLCREQARMVIPLSSYTEWYWKIDLKNLLHFLDLRCDSHSQWEIQEYGNAILKLISPIVPWTIEAWEDYSPYRGGVLLTRFEVEKMRHILHTLPNKYNVPLGEEEELFEDIEEIGKLENREWKWKAQKLGLI